MLAVEVAQALGVPLLEWHIKSTTKAQRAVRVRRGEPARAAARREGTRLHNYIVRRALERFRDKPCVLLIDEVDKAASSSRTTCCAGSTA
jgi:MoxR-like ATPase